MPSEPRRDTFTVSGSVPPEAAPDVSAPVTGSYGDAVPGAARPPEPADLDPQPTAPLPGHPLLVYSLLRLALLVLLTVVLALFMPLIVAALFAVILQLPLAWFLLGRFRQRANESLARSAGRRRAERERLRRSLEG
ncbi:DUF4229 domain-containing protein [Nakamurella endophytica]|uniref:DUF4229 domain-containing protein n=1 Tax=Nakamurella endophytica TaxID=1748367 RepID=A0A917WHB3_9ACTN|nr:DUF4229 domain-containing protein [Nakamurella endophytica]GGM04000.1 hypothetical protein GCM10011594_25220 [Nakamurella endophytica]